MKIRPESWLLNKDKSVLLNIDNGKVIRKCDGYFKICSSIDDLVGYCRLAGKETEVERGNEEKYFIDELLFDKLKRIFRDGFDYSDYNLF